MLAWSTGGKLEEIMALCSCSNAQFKPRGDCKALSLAVVLGQDSYRDKSLARQRNSLFAEVTGAHSVLQHEPCLDQQLTKLPSPTPTGMLAAVHYL